MSNARRHGSTVNGANAAGPTNTTGVSTPGGASIPASSGVPLQPSTADDATTTLIRNTLIPTSSIQKPLEATLPALTSFPDIDKELYAFIALILRQFVQGWYTSIADDDVADRAFVYEVVHIIAHVTRSLEERLRKAELEMLLLDDVPLVLDAHLRDFRLARQKVGTAYAAGKSFEEMFHALQPHPALRPPKRGNDMAEQQADQGPPSPDDVERKFLVVLSKGILAVLLPSEDLGSATERTLLRSLLADVVLWKTIDKLSEPFMLHEIISKVIEKSLKNDDLAADIEPEVLLSQPAMDASPKPTKIMDAVRSFTSSFMSFCSLLQAGIVFLVSFARSTRSAEHTLGKAPNSPQFSLLTIALFPTAARLLNLPARQPWLMSTIELLALPLVSLPPGSLIDRLLSHFFHKYIMTSQFACSVLALSRQTLFPNNGPMAEPRIYPDDAEKGAILKRVYGNILRVVPMRVRKQVLGDDALQGLEELLSPFENKFANKHLLYFLFDMVIVKVLPELALKTPEELKVWRLGEEEGAAATT
ncbi:PXA domain-containing protein [Lipomyces kononenkoae]|uniref:PXA domain-containing protein n=1 Tax=Lipomyces kononenkoae TaxID=34357 RepID=A0ACC3SXH1_LIPKO